jgi:hypothetical protein
MLSPNKVLDSNPKSRSSPQKMFFGARVQKSTQKNVRIPISFFFVAPLLYIKTVNFFKLSYKLLYVELRLVPCIYKEL